MRCQPFSSACPWNFGRSNKCRPQSLSQGFPSISTSQDEVESYEEMEREEIIPLFYPTLNVEVFRSGSRYRQSPYKRVLTITIIFPGIPKGFMASQIFSWLRLSKAWNYENCSTIIFELLIWPVHDLSDQKPFCPFLDFPSTDSRILSKMIRLNILQGLISEWFIFSFHIQNDNEK